MTNNLTTSRPARRTVGLAVAATAAVTGLTACQGSTSGTGVQDSGPDGGRSRTAETATHDTRPHKLLWMGDSVGEVQAPALGAAMKAGGAAFASMAVAGGGGVIGETAAPTWDELPKRLAAFKPDVVAYQITTYDWGTADEQRAGYERLAKTVSDAGAELLLVSAPPFKFDDFYKKHEAAIRTAPQSAREVADNDPDGVHFLDASALWGTDATAAKAQRSKDGIHSCQQGSAAFAAWFGKELNKRYSFTPARPQEWANGSWTGEKVFGQIGCA
ncbi:SGNH/GDSL hydrolase family protein [Streptomyces sp. AHA2]|uniref:SGNH/GDSL hydrolase family protein n=1 Tax=Streptomyces sp. AHA2 TaxID=3064526 RepID=UPI002FE1A76B